MYPLYPHYSWKKECNNVPVAFPAQHQPKQPGLEYVMNPLPIFDYDDYKGSGKLTGRTAIITGGDSGIGRAAAVAYAKEGANLVLGYLEYEEKDAFFTKQYVEKLGARCELVEGDMRFPETADKLVQTALKCYGCLNIVVNNCGVQYPQDSILDITIEQLYQTFEVNVFSFVYLIQKALPHLKEGDSIINNASIVAYEGNDKLIDYSATKGAIVSLTRSLALSIADQGIRVNAIAPGYFWTALQPASWQDSDEIESFGTDAAMKRAGQPFEIAPAFVYLAADDSRYVTGETLHINGGKFVTC